MSVVRITAFGALNQDSYDVFAGHLAANARAHGVDVALKCAAPYPNAAAVSEPGRPLRAEALQDEAKKQELFEAVAADAKNAGADGTDILCMPCMSMVGFHAGVEAALGRKIFKLEDALSAHYNGIPKIGILHMRPAKPVIERIFGERAVTPAAAQAEKLAAAEDAARRNGKAAPVEAAMRDIAQDWRAEGLSQILFARADAPKAAARIEGAEIHSYFDILAEAVVASCKA